MTGVREYFTKLDEKKLDFSIELGNNSKYHATSVCMVKFQRDSGKPLLVEDMLYVPDMTKNLIFASTLEENGYIMTFEWGKIYIHPKNSKVEKEIGARHGNLFGLQFGPTQALVSSTRGLVELWH
ncbi:uncharacterized protein LOC131859989 [Cryptomeria japonica]|uniref:uncharacterized protein LOC131859989 n=1 Tax=Cryptomeria japonica TaxID=3369 RepID=UPI0027DA4083|nr:uncharacterized protein LOC131859989 [Cryptomeria japonica]